MKRLVRFLAFCFYLAALSVGPAHAGPSRLSYLGSSVFSAPTAYVRSEGGYIIDNGSNLGWFSQPVFGKFLELSGARYTSGDFKNKNVLNLKVNCLEESKWIPNVVYGCGDFQKVLGSRVFFWAASKTFEEFGFTVHGGFIKDPVTTRKKGYFSLEKTIMPLVTLAGELIDGHTTVGVKLRPYPGVSAEYAHRQAKGEAEQAIYRLIYVKGF